MNELQKILDHRPTFGTNTALRFSCTKASRSFIHSLLSAAGWLIRNVKGVWQFKPGINPASSWRVCCFKCSGTLSSMSKKNASAGTRVQSSVRFRTPFFTANQLRRLALLATMCGTGIFVFTGSLGAKKYSRRAIGLKAGYRVLVCNLIAERKRDYMKFLQNSAVRAHW